ncbi:MAG: YfcC family protein [Ignavibacteria bacterium]|nr:YfcC family protein [Ignavibacteria bacterium]MDH7528097.1 YfcC family protein [Ignavibacteria bacterium]
MKNNNKFKLRVPNTYLLIFSLLVLIAILTWIIPGGKYERSIVNGREVVIPGSFKYVESNPQDLFDLFIAPLKGFKEAALIIGFILFVGGAFNVLTNTGAIDAFIKKLLLMHNKSPFMRAAFIPLLVILFSFGGATFGMNEEVIPFVLILVPIALALGYDSIVGVAIPLIGAHIGFASAYLNPFNVGIAQGIAELPLFSGMGYRVFCWIISTTIAIIFIANYSRKVHRNPSISLVFDIDKERKLNELNLNLNSEEKLTLRHKLVLLIFVLSLAGLVVGVIEFQWFIEEISALFVIMGLLAGILGGLKTDQIVSSFINGAKDLVGTAIIVALARATLVISRDANIIDTILYGLTPFVESSSPIFSAQKMFIVQAIINFFVHSGSGQAALTMPIMAPLADLTGVSRQTAILAFQFGEYTNIIIPTSAVTMGALTMAKVPWERWAKWVLPLMIILFLLGFILLIPPFLINYQ